MKAQPDYSIYLVTDDGCLQGRALIDCVREALEGGVTRAVPRQDGIQCGDV